MLDVKILTAYPNMFPGTLNHSLIGSALKEKKWTLEVINLHNFGYDNTRSILVMIILEVLMMSLLEGVLA